MINNGANNELQTSLKVSCDCDDVFDAIESAIKTYSYSIQSSNKLSHTIMFKTPTSLTSYGEDVTINVGETFDGKTEIGILCIPRNNNLQPANLAKARKNFNNIIEQISTAVSKCKRVEGKTQAGGSTQVSPAAQIKEFKELLDIGAITQEEYELKKNELLGLKIESTTFHSPSDVLAKKQQETEFNSDSQVLNSKGDFLQEEPSSEANLNQEKQESNDTKHAESGKERAVIVNENNKKARTKGVILAATAVVVGLMLISFYAGKALSNHTALNSSPSQGKISADTNTFVSTSKTETTNKPDNLLPQNGVLEFGYNDHTVFSSYLTNGTYRAGKDFEPGDYYAIGIYKGIELYNPAANPEEIKSAGRRTFCKLSIVDGQYIKIDQSGILVSAKEVDVSDLMQYGIFRVGIDIPAGVYKIETISKEYHTDFAYVSGIWGGYQISSDNPCEIGASFSKGDYLFDDQGYLTLKDGDYVGIINLRMALEE